MRFSIATLTFWFLLQPAAGFGAEPGEAWTGFRGDGDGVTQTADLPLTWSHQSNIAWVADLPGYGQSTPVVWGDAVFVTSTEGRSKETFIVRRYSVGDGSLVWERRFPSSRPQEAGERTSRAAPSPAVDEGLLYLLFDSGDLVAVTHDGEDRWSLDLNSELGPIVNGHDFGSSLRQSSETLFVQISHLGPSQIAAISKADGSILWRVEAPPEGGWQTPVVARSGAGELLLIAKEGGVSALDPATGREQWSHSAGKASQARAVPSLALADNAVIVPSMQRGETYLLRFDNPSTPVWHASRATTQYSTPLVYQGRAYMVNAVGVLFCISIQDGEELWQTRLPGQTWASAIAAGDRIYFFTLDGATAVIRAGDADKAEILAVNTLPTVDRVYAASAAGDGVFIREASRLWRLAEVESGVVLPPPTSRRAEPDDLLSRIVPYQFPESETPPQPGDSFTHPLDGLELVRIPGGGFMMGCSPGDSDCEDDERPVRKVTISRDFWMHRTETTVGAFRRFSEQLELPMPESPRMGGAELNPDWSEDDQPILNVTWYEARAYCAWIGGRLPTEAEWEYAARAGTEAASHGLVDEVAWYADNSGREALDSADMIVNHRPRYMEILAENGNRPQMVGVKPPNAFGLHDMLGNAAEWSADWHGPYEDAADVDPKGPEDGERRVTRGGGWSLYPSRLRVSSRGKSSRDSRTSFTGFRCVLD